MFDVKLTRSYSIYAVNYFRIFPWHSQDLRCLQSHCSSMGIVLCPPSSPQTKSRCTNKVKNEKGKKATLNKLHLSEQVQWKWDFQKETWLHLFLPLPDVVNRDSWIQVRSHVRNANGNRWDIYKECFVFENEGTPQPPSPPPPLL